MDIIPYAVDWTAANVGPVLASVRDYRIPAAPRGAGWTYGCDTDFLQRLCAYWTDGYGWEGVRDGLNAWPQFRARIDDQDIHFVHVVGEAEGRRPLLLTHGWPGSHFEFWGVIERLAFPTRFGGEARDAFDLVIASLPGYGFSGKPERIVGQRETAAMFHRLMVEGLGYGRYMAHGGDWGARVTSVLGLNHPEALRGIHLSMIGLRPTLGPQDDDEKAWVARSKAASAVYGGYSTLQATKPQSIAYAMAGNPVGQAAWIVERFHDWSDLRTRSLEEVVSLSDLLTNVMIYVMNDAFTTAAWYYRAGADEGPIRMAPGQRCETPTAFANFRGEPLYTAPPKSWADRAYNIVRWTDYAEGGHFAAMDQPGVLVADLQAFARELA